MKKRPLRPLAATLFVLGALVVGKLIADCAKPTDGVSQNQQASDIKVLAADDGGVVCQSCIDSAAATWNASCASGTKPDFVGASSSADITAFVRFTGGANPGTFEDCSASKCACTELDIDPSNGEITLATIRIWETASGQQNCTGSATDILTHELAHVLGIDDPPAGCDNCTNIMGSVTGPIDAQVCDQANDNFQTDTETQDPPDTGHPCRPQVA